ncbi:Clavaminate synthase-like protein [Aspergillus parasiticus]|uniref:Clavaminate synthase-like protein n=1 Tax=Aspergillus parasiticus TaxID=5067 RepID=A0A5N6DYZ3_ASPPA|nr:Clavaminate synthase-like protein [Aspergillus parasiticus]
MSATTVHAASASAPQTQASRSKDLLTFDGRTYGDWRDDFHKHGFAIVKGAVSPERAEYYRQKQIAWLQSFGLGFDPNDRSTWTKDHLPYSFKGGMYSAYAATHEKFVWEARMEPNVIKAFSDLWGTDELLVSFDGMNISLPNQKDLTWSPWPHVDQNPERKGMQCVQGLLNFAPNGPNDGGLLLMKGSSKLFDTFFTQKREADAHEDAPPPEANFRDLFLFQEKDVQWYKDNGCELIKTCLEPGDLVLWDSRTMHYACLPEGDVIRSVQYVCMTPRKFANEEDIKLKAQLFHEFEGTTHWPHCNIHRHGPPMRDGVIDPQNRTEPLEKPVLSDRLLQLAGVKDY